jgi:hypothetical protein
LQFPTTTISETLLIKIGNHFKMFSGNTLFATAALLASAVNAHVKMVSPAPYGNPDTSPLSASGSNYPCKTDNGFTINSVTNITVGKPVTLSFSGTAVHNGGSCQLSMTPGYKPDTNSAFKVFYSIEGACPGLNGQTNTYQFTVPNDIPNGQYSMAWTWYNNIGNREIYMNCAPVTVAGSSGTQQTMDALPDMAIFNIPSKNSCGTLETFDVAFPNPGKYVTTGSTYKPTPPSNCGNKAASSGGAGGASPASSYAPGSGSGGASSAAAQAPVSSAAAGAGSSPTATSFLTYTQTATVTGGAASSAPTGGVFGEGSNGNLTNSNPTPPAPVASSSILASAGSAATGAPAAAAGAMACSTNGALMCSADGSMQGLCNFGSAVMMPVAAGTKCVNGQITFAKRSAKFGSLFGL